MVSISFTWQYQEVPADDPDGEFAALAQWERLKFNLSYARNAKLGARFCAGCGRALANENAGQ